MIQTTQTVRELMDLMIKAGLEKEVGTIIVTNLKTEAQQKAMIDYLKEDIRRTNTQAMQQLKKIINK